MSNRNQGVLPYVALVLAVLVGLAAPVLIDIYYQPVVFSKASHLAVVIAGVFAALGVWIAIRARSSFAPASLPRWTASVVVIANVLLLIWLVAPIDLLIKLSNVRVPGLSTAEPSAVVGPGNLVTVSLKGGVKFRIPAHALSHRYRVSFDRVRSSPKIVPPEGMTLVGVFDFKLDCLDELETMQNGVYNPPSWDREQKMKVANRSLRMLIPAPIGARLGAFVAITVPQRGNTIFEKFNGFWVVDVGSVVEYEGRKYFSTIEEGQIDRDGMTCQDVLDAGKGPCMLEDHGLGLFTSQKVAVFYETEPKWTVKEVPAEPSNYWEGCYVLEQADFITHCGGVCGYRDQEEPPLCRSALYIAPNQRIVTLVSRDLSAGWVMEKQTVLVNNRSIVRHR